MSWCAVSSRARTSQVSSLTTRRSCSSSVATSSNCCRAVEPGAAGPAVTRAMASGRTPARSASATCWHHSYQASQRHAMSAPAPADGSGPRDPGERRGWVPSWSVVIGITLAMAGLVAISVLAGPPPAETEELDYGTFRSRVAAGEVAEVLIHQDSGRVEGHLVEHDEEFTVQGPPGGSPEADIRLLDAHRVERNYAAEESDSIGTFLLYLLPFVLISGLLVWLSRRATSQLSGATSFTRSRARVSRTERPETTFADVAGYDAVKEEIREVVDFLRDPSAFDAIGARVPKGILLVGPPGTGKTLVARAVAGEAGVPFISITGSEFLEMFVGVGAARVRDLFATARKETPSIVFVDEIDAIGRKRGTGLGGGHDDREQTLNQLLAEMDGFETSEGIVMLAATNRPGFVARGTPGMSGAELANVVNEAALIAVRRGADAIARSDFDGARDRVLLGLRRTSLVLTADEKRTVAVHEAGHAPARPRPARRRSGP
jgi:cell division protease FtsH